VALDLAPGTALPGRILPGPASLQQGTLALVVALKY
jgi:hypothetical protein